MILFCCDYLFFLLSCSNFERCNGFEGDVRIWIRGGCNGFGIWLSFEVQSKLACTLVAVNYWFLVYFHFLTSLCSALVNELDG